MVTVYLNNSKRFALILTDVHGLLHSILYGYLWPWTLITFPNKEIRKNYVYPCPYTKPAYQRATSRMHPDPQFTSILLGLAPTHITSASLGLFHAHLCNYVFVNTRSFPDVLCQRLICLWRLILGIDWWGWVFEMSFLSFRFYFPSLATEIFCLDSLPLSISKPRIPRNSSFAHCKSSLFLS